MYLLARSRPAFGPWLFLFLFVVFAAGCQDGSGPGLATGPEAQSTLDKKPPQPPPTPADPAIVFNGVDGLTVMNADGTNAKAILAAGSQGPSWSPGGDAIVLDGKLDGVGGIWRVDVRVVAGVPVATDARMLVEGPNDGLTGLIRPAWSPVVPPWSSNGEQIAYTRNGVGGTPLEFRRIEVVPAEGGDPVILYTSASGAALDQVTWRSDATQIAFTEGGAIRVLDIASGQATTVLDASWGQQVGGGADLPRLGAHPGRVGVPCWPIGAEWLWSRLHHVIAKRHADLRRWRGPAR